MEKKVRFGMIGCGQIMPSTAKGIMESKLCSMVRVYDPDRDAAQQGAKDFDLAIGEDFWDFISAPDIDAVYVAVPHAMHVPIAVEAARAGKHVMVEKPMATDVADAQILVAECRKAGVKLSSAMGMRYSSFSQIARGLIQQGAIGKVNNYLVRSIGMKDEKYWSNGVFGQARRSYWRPYWGLAGGGILIMNAVHNLDALYYITGLEPVEVMAMGGTYTANVAVEDAISMLIRFKQENTHAVCEAMSSAYGASHTDNTTVIYGTKGTIRFGHRCIELFTTVEGLGYETGKFVEIPCTPSNTRVDLMDGFASAILEDTEPLISGSDGVLITDLITSAYRSMKSRRPERLVTASGG